MCGGPAVRGSWGQLGLLVGMKGSLSGCVVRAKSRGAGH